MNTDVCKAIAERALIRFWYRDDPKDRVIEPYAHGFGSAGQELLHGYQLRGFSRSDHEEGWKLFEVVEVHKLEILEDRMGDDRLDYHTERSIHNVHCHV